jgi:putative hemolysin
MPPTERPDVIPPVPIRKLVHDFDALPDRRTLLRAGEIRVVAARAYEMPHVMDEVGRLRELTFREAGEGTGNASDLDVHDGWYEHIVAWDEHAQAIVGAYRIADIPEVLEREGLPGLYTATLFDYDIAFFDTLGPAAELGRSFVRSEYQTGSALWILWRGIGQWLARHPACRHLVGPVSIDRRYTDRSIRAMAAELEGRLRDEDLAPLVRPTVPLPRGPTPILPSTGDPIQALEQRVRSLEPDGRGMPTLLRHYLKLGARALALNVDRAFADVIDALVVVSLDRVDPHRLVRFMGPDAVLPWLAAGKKAS